MASILTAAANALDDLQNDVEQILDDAVIGDAQRLVNRQRSGEVILAETFDNPHRALMQIAERLEELEAGRALQRYVLSNAAKFFRSTKAKPGVITVTADDVMPVCRFKGGMTELACIGSSGGRVEGSSYINVRATPMGTAMTSNAADVDAMFTGVKGVSLWVRFEAPTRADIGSMMNDMEATLASVIEVSGGIVTADDLARMISDIEHRQSVPSDVVELIEAVLTLQNALKNGALDQKSIEGILADIKTAVERGQEEGLMPDSLVHATMTALSAMANDSPILAASFLQTGLVSLMPDNDNISAETQVAHILDELSKIAEIEGLSADAKDVLQKLIETAQDALSADSPDLQNIITELSGAVLQFAERPDIPAAAMQAIADSIIPELAIVQAEVAQSSLGHTHGEAVLALLETIARKIEAGEVSQDSLPPELTALIEEMGGVQLLLDANGRAARIESLALALKVENFDQPLSQSVQAAILKLADGTMLPGMNADLAKTIEAFAKENPKIVEIIATQAMIAELSRSLATYQPGTQETAALTSAIDALKKGGFAALLNPDIQSAMPAVAKTLIQTFSEKHMPTINIAASHAYVSALSAAQTGISKSSSTSVELSGVIRQIQKEGVSAFLERQTPLSPNAAAIVTSLFVRSELRGVGQVATKADSNGATVPARVANDRNGSQGIRQAVSGAAMVTSLSSAASSGKAVPASAAVASVTAAAGAPSRLTEIKGGAPATLVAKAEGKTSSPDTKTAANDQTGPQALSAKQTAAQPQGDQSAAAARKFDNQKIAPDNENQDKRHGNNKADASKTDQPGKNQDRVKACCRNKAPVLRENASEDDRRAYKQEREEFKQTVEAGNPKPNSDGTLPKGEYVRVEGEKIVISTETGRELKSFTTEEWNREIKATAIAETQLSEMKRVSASREDLTRALAGLSFSGSHGGTDASGLTGTFEHVCGDGCDHGGTGKAPAAPQERIEGVDFKSVNFEAIENGEPVKRSAKSFGGPKMQM